MPKGVYTHKKGNRAPNWKGGVTFKAYVCAECKSEFVGHKRKFCSKDCAYRNKELQRKKIASRVANGNAHENDLSRYCARKYAEYVCSARRRGISFELDRSDVVQLLTSGCYFCGVEIAMGIDRLDPDSGYTTNNSVGCCSKCNFAKHTMTVDEFKEHVTVLYYNFVNNQSL